MRKPPRARAQAFPRMAPRESSFAVGVLRASRRRGLYARCSAPFLCKAILTATFESMDSTSIELPGSEIESISLRNGCLRVHFSRAYIIKTMTGSEERTRWWQSGDLIMDGAEVREGIPPGPLVCAGGDIDENVYTYRDMVPLPMKSRGRTACRLRFEGTDAQLIADAETVVLEMRDVPKYIGHIRPGDS